MEAYSRKQCLAAELLGSAFLLATVVGSGIMSAKLSGGNEQYFEMFANRGIYHDGWYACTTPPAPPWAMGTTKLPEVADYKWELYNLTEDYSQNNDLAAKNPDKLKAAGVVPSGGAEIQRPPLG